MHAKGFNNIPGDKGAAALIEYSSRPAEDTLLLISLPKLDGSAQKTKWGKALVEQSLRAPQAGQMSEVVMSRCPAGIQCLYGKPSRVSV